MTEARFNTARRVAARTPASIRAAYYGSWLVALHNWFDLCCHGKPSVLRPVVYLDKACKSQSSKCPGPDWQVVKPTNTYLTVRQFLLSILLSP
jgi:hypothetical protein